MRLDVVPEPACLVPDKDVDRLGLAA